MIERDLMRIQRFRFAQIARPIPLQIEFRGDNVFGIANSAFTLAMRRAMQSTPRLLELGGTVEADVGLTLILSPNSAEINVATLPGCTIRLTKGASGSQVTEQLPYDLLLGIATAFARYGHMSFAADLVLYAARRASLLTDLRMATTLAAILTQARRFTASLELSEFLRAKRVAGDVADVFTLPALAGLRTLSNDERVALLRTLESGIRSALEQEEFVHAASLCFSLGQYHQDQRECRRALAAFRRAQRLDSRYCERPHFLSRVAGVCFDGGHPRFAERFYRRAIERGASGRIVALHGDALLFSGRLSEAETRFNDYLSAAEDPEPEWVLKNWAIEKMLALVGAGQVERQVCAAWDRAASEAADGPATGVETLLSALELDPLCPLAWWKLALLWSKKEEDSDLALVAFGIAAITRPENLEAWFQAFSRALGLSGQRGVMLAHAFLAAAYRIHRDAILDHTHDFVRQLGEDFPTDQLMDTILDWIQALQTPPEPLTLRIWDDRGAPTEIEWQVLR